MSEAHLKERSVGIRHKDTAFLHFASSLEQANSARSSSARATKSRSGRLQSSRITFRLRGRMRRARRCLQKTETRGFRASVGSVLTPAKPPGLAGSVNLTQHLLRFASKHRTL